MSLSRRAARPTPWSIALAWGFGIGTLFLVACRGPNPAFNGPVEASGSTTTAGTSGSSTGSSSLVAETGGGDAAGSASQDGGSDDGNNTNNNTSNDPSSDSTSVAATDGGEVMTLSFGEGPADVTGVTRDNFILAEIPTQNAGDHRDMHVAEDGEAVALLSFDLTAIGSGSEVLDAQLQLSTGTPFGGAGTIETGEVSVYVLLEQWDEGGSNESFGHANWLERLPGVPWTAAGAGVGSRGPEVLASFAPSAPDTSYVLSVPIEVVQKWIDDPATNFGLALTADEPNNYAWLMSSEANDSGQRPLLTVSFR